MSESNLLFRDNIQEILNEMLKETSDKSISQSVSDVNSSVVDTNSIYLVKNDESNVVINNCYNDSSAKACFNANSGITALPVPLGWKRLLVDGSIIYLSPTNIALSSIEQVKMYLQTIGTCKCGLECPVNCDSVFNFNPKVISRPWDSSDSDQIRLCNHKRKAPGLDFYARPDKNAKLNRHEVMATKRKKKKSGTGSSGVSVSQLLAQRDRAWAAAAAAAGGGRWPAPAPLSENSGYQNVIANQYPSGGVQLVRNQAQVRQQLYESGGQCGESVVKREAPPGRLPDDKVGQFPCVNVIGNSVGEGTVVSVNGLSQVLPENHPTESDLMRAQQIGLSQRQDAVDQNVLGQTMNYNQQEFVQGTVVASKPEGIVLAPQGMLFPSNMIMQRPRSIPPWHQTRLNKPVPETPVVYEKVPFVQQQIPAGPTLIYDDVSVSRKKPKSTTAAKKTSQETQPQTQAQPQPSFMENPSAYLAQQTALLHNTISRPNFNLVPDVKGPGNETQASSGSDAVTSATSAPNGLGQVQASYSRNPTYAIRSGGPQKVDNSNFVQSQQKGIVSEKENVSDSTEALFKATAGYEGFEGVTFGDQVYSSTGNSYSGGGSVSDSRTPCLFGPCDETDTSSNQKMTEKIMFIQESLERSEADMFTAGKDICEKGDWRWPDCGGSELAALSDSVTNNGDSPEENPVTSSTEKATVLYNEKVVVDSRPIQGGTVSTSNGSPQPQPSPKTVEMTSPSPAQSSIQISSTNSFSTPETGQMALDTLPGGPDAVRTLQTLQSIGCISSRSDSPGREQKFKHANRNFLNVTISSDPGLQSSSDDQSKVGSVTSSLDDRESVQGDRVESKGSRFVRTMASSHTASSNTITSVQAGRTQTATVTVSNNSSTPSTTISLVNLAKQTVLSVPAGPKTKSPLEMVQSVVSSIQTSGDLPSKADLSASVVSVNSKNLLPTTSNALSSILTSSANVTTSILATDTTTGTPVLKTSPGGLQTGHILVSSNGQYIVASNGNVIPQTNLSGLKLNQAGSVSPMNASPVVTNVSGAITQVLPAVGVAQQVLGQSTVLVNALPAPFVIQPGVMAVDTGLGPLAMTAGNVLQGNVIENNTLRTAVRGTAVPTEKLKTKKGGKKRKNPVASVVQMTSPNNVILNQPFGPQNFAVSPGGSVQPLQALTLVQGKHGGPTQIVMNNQNNFNQFNGQPQQINVLQPVNLTSVPNFPAFQQFIVPGLGNMVMSTDGTTAILPETTNIGVQLQLQNVNGQNVLTPVQNSNFINGQGILTTAPTGMIIRAPNSQQKILQNSPSPQFLSPNNSQFLVNQFQGQLSPLIAASLSPNQQIFAGSPQRQSPQDFIQIIPTSGSQNATLVQTDQPTATAMVSTNQGLLTCSSGKSNFLLNGTGTGTDKSIELQILGTSQQRSGQSSGSVQQLAQQQTQAQAQHRQQKILVQEKMDFGTQHSVSTQTSVGEDASNSVGVSTNNTFCQTLNSNWSGSPPDTTTHSPVESEANYVRASTPADDRPDSLPQAMVQYVSSSMNEAESETESYLLPGGTTTGTSNPPKVLGPCETRRKTRVESSTAHQDTGIQVQVGSSYSSCPDVSVRSTVDECVVSSHSDVNVQDKRVGSQSNILSYQDDDEVDKVRLVGAMLADNKPDDLNDEELTDWREKLSEGDLVWGPVRGSPAWPGKLVGPITSSGKALVRWFGGHTSPTKVNVSQLKSLSQGLEAHHRASNKGRKRRRLNVDLEAAIQEAMLELDRMAARAKKAPAGRGRPRRVHRLR